MVRCPHVYSPNFLSKLRIGDIGPSAVAPSVLCAIICNLSASSFNILSTPIINSVLSSMCNRWLFQHSASLFLHLLISNDFFLLSFLRDVDLYDNLPFIHTVELPPPTFPSNHSAFCTNLLRSLVNYFHVTVLWPHVNLHLPIFSYFRSLSSSFFSCVYSLCSMVHYFNNSHADTLNLIYFFYSHCTHEANSKAWPSAFSISKQGHPYYWRTSMQQIEH